MLSPCFTFNRQNRCAEPSKTGISFYCVEFSVILKGIYKYRLNILA